MYIDKLGFSLKAKICDKVGKAFYELGRITFGEKMKFVLAASILSLSASRGRSGRVFELIVSLVF